MKNCILEQQLLIIEKIKLINVFQWSFKHFLMPVDYNVQSYPISTIKKADYLQTIYFKFINKRVVSLV